MLGISQVETDSSCYFLQRVRQEGKTDEGKLGKNRKKPRSTVG